MFPFFSAEERHLYHATRESKGELMNAERAQLITRLDFTKCTRYHRDCFELKDRHWPYYGILGDHNWLHMTRLDVLALEGGKMYNLANVPMSKEWMPKIGMRMPEGYKSWSSSQYGSEDWLRYGPWNARLPSLVAGDIIIERYGRSPYIPLPIESKYFLVLDDAKTHLWLLPMDKIPKDPRELLRSTLGFGVGRSIRR